MQKPGDSGKYQDDIKDQKYLKIPVIKQTEAIYQTFKYKLSIIKNKGIFLY